MKNDIRCAACHLMQITGRAAVTSNNSHFVGSRGNCHCKHPEADAAFKLICPDSGRMPGFIAFTKRGTNEPDIKTAPRWCPRKLAEEPKEVSKAEAYRIIDTRRPQGMFFLKEGNGYTGIDNRTGDAWTEEFPTKAECPKWLTDEGGEDDE